MADKTKKRVVLTLERRVEAINKLDLGIPAYKIAEEMGVGKTQIQNLRKQRAEFISDFQNNVPGKSKRRRYLTGNEEINELTLAWFKDAVSRRINVTGPLLQTKALEFAKSLGNTEFKASRGWLESFNKRNNLTFGSMSGERGDVKCETVVDWKKKLPTLCEGFDDKDIFNMDETGLFFRDTSRKTFHVKGDDCAGGKRSKQRITVALCASLTGEKLKPVVIGKSRKPRCFKNVNTDSLPVHYYNNKKAWMNSKIYEDFLKSFNRKMKLQGRNVLLFVDNAPSHPTVNLSHVKVQFLPPNTTSYTQPMDQGIIQTTKLKFRKRQLLHMVKEMDRQPTANGSDLLNQISILDAILWINNSWKEVEATTIQKCFYKAGFGQKPESENSANDDELDDDIPLAAVKMSYELFGCAYRDLVDIDNNLYTCNTQPVDWSKPVSELLNPDDNVSDEGSDDEDEVQSAVVLPSLGEANDMVVKLKALALNMGSSDMLDIVGQLDETLCSVVAKRAKQSKITEFFKCERAK